MKKDPAELASPAEGSWSCYLGIGIGLWKMVIYARPWTFNWVGDAGVPAGSPDPLIPGFLVADGGIK